MINLSYSQKQELGGLLERLATSIDLTETQYKDAISRYEAVSAFLADPAGSLAPYRPGCRSQGSIRIGTAVNPVDEECEFDVDVTCWLDISLPVVQAFVKGLIGDRFKSDGTYRYMLKEKKRCWRLKYHEASRFHMDIVPAISDDFNWLLALGVPYKYAQHAILITDNTLHNYYDNSYELPRSNTEGYALWFTDIMRIQADQIRMKLAAELRMSVDRIPEYKVRTPLQRGIQLMKRHRDIMFGDDELRPISIIITTLAAKAYELVMQSQSSNLFYDIIVAMVRLMPRFIEYRNGIAWIVNPVNPNENFADKWQEDQELAESFFRWHTAFLNSLENERLIDKPVVLGDHLRKHFGIRAANAALNITGYTSENERIEGLKKAAAAIAGDAAYTDRRGNVNTSNLGVKNEPHRFHFDERKNKDPQKKRL
ncbi:nucleotidyltransferase [Pedobacter frigoris]|uniref:nucleotidyltransferase domain-containing protein n=1 Tax=Pedobacter frigoris TaxID=2571272 RepID=UPI00292D723D|nr:nucleotidyltransferase [Pedobacter frigoris]